MQRNIMAVDVLRAISDDDSLNLFNFIATEKERRIDAATLQTLNGGLTKKQYYMRINNLTNAGLIKKSLGIFQLTSFGKIIYFSKIKIDSAIKSYWALIAVDSFEATREINSDVLRKLINSVISDNFIKDILLGEN
jgi:hypothetical protein